jgi:hypothetical protein
MVDDYVKAAVESLDATPLPRVYRKWAAVSSVAGAMGRKVWLDRGFYWLRPNLYVVLVGPPANGKTASCQLPLIDVFKALALEPGTKSDHEDYNPKLLEYDMEDRPFCLLKDRITPESLGVELKRAEQIRFDLRGRTRTGGQFYDNSATLLTSEFGTFMEREARNAQALITEMWDALEDYQYKTKTAGKYLIRGPCLNWLACATQTELVGNLPSNARGQGLLSRMILVYASTTGLTEQLRYDAANADMVNRLRETLAVIAKLEGEFVLHPSIESKVDSDIAEGLLPIPQDDNMQEYNGRRSSHVLKVAMALSASRSNTMMITEQDWEEAKEMLFEAEALMPLALQGFGMGKAGQTAVEIESFIKTMCASSGRSGVSEGVLKREVLRRSTNASEVDTILTVMENANMIRKTGTIYRLVGDKTEESPLKLTGS